MFKFSQSKIEYSLLGRENFWKSLNFVCIYIYTHTKIKYIHENQTFLSFNCYLAKSLSLELCVYIYIYTQIYIYICIYIHRIWTGVWHNLSLQVPLWLVISSKTQADYHAPNPRHGGKGWKRKRKEGSDYTVCTLSSRLLYSFSLGAVGVVAFKVFYKKRFRINR